MTIELYPHQQKAVDELSNGKILVGGVGTGKSKTAVAYYMKNETPRDVYVVTTAKKRDNLDWHKEFVQYGVYTSPETTVAGVLTVISWNEISKYEEVKNVFFIFDESRVGGSGAWSKAFITIAKSNRWILLSATPGDTWLDYIPVFIANGYYKNRTDFKRTHVIYNSYSKFPKVDRYVGVGLLLKQRNSLLVEMPYMRHTVRKTSHVVVEHDQVLFNEVAVKRWHVFKERPLRNVGEMFHVLRKVVNSDPSRFLAVRELLQKHPKLIVFYSFDYELEMLRELSEDVTIAEWNGHFHQSIPSTDRWVYLVQYQAGAEGWNCVQTDAMCFFSLPYSYKSWHQAHGRIDRLNTPFEVLNYYVLRSNSMIDNAIWKSLQSKKSFNEKALNLPFSVNSENTFENV